MLLRTRGWFWLLWWVQSFVSFAFLVSSGAVSAVEADPCARGALVATTAADPPRVFHYVFLVDTSMSMMGHGDGKGRVLLPRVKEELEKFLEQVPPGSRVTLQPFDDAPKPPQTFEIPKDKAAAVAYVRGIEAKGKRTCVYRTLKRIVSDWPGNAQTGVLVFLLTDGNNNCPPPPTLEDVVSDYRLRRGPYDWIYYLLLGLEINSELEEALGREDGWQLLAVPPNKVPRLPVVEVEPKLLDLGNLYQGDLARREILVRAPGEQAGSLPLRVRTVSADLGGHGSSLTVSPELLSAPGTQALNFQLLNRESLPEGEIYRAHLCLESSDPDVVLKPVGIPIQFRYHPSGVFTLEPLDGSEPLTLEPGASAQLRYRLNGDRWARGTVTVAPHGALEGLDLRLNGNSGPIQLAAGDVFTVEMTNTGITAREQLQPQLDFTFPSGTAGPAMLSLPAVARPLTCWERALDWWWLWLLLALLLFALGMTVWTNCLQLWGILQGTGPAPECREFSAVPLRGRKPIDLGRLLEIDELRGMKIQRAGRRYARLTWTGASGAPLDIYCEPSKLENGDPIALGEKVKVLSGNKEVASFVIRDPKERV